MIYDIKYAVCSYKGLFVCNGVRCLMHALSNVSRVPYLYGLLRARIINSHPCCDPILK